MFAIPRPKGIYICLCYPFHSLFLKLDQLAHNPNANSKALRPTKNDKQSTQPSTIKTVMASLSLLCFFTSIFLVICK